MFLFVFQEPLNKSVHAAFNAVYLTVLPLTLFAYTFKFDFLKDIADGVSEDTGCQADDPGVIPADQHGEENDQSDGKDPVAQPESFAAPVQLDKWIHADGSVRGVFNEIRRAGSAGTGTEIAAAFIGGGSVSAVSLVWG